MPENVAKNLVQELLKDDFLKYRRINVKCQMNDYMQAKKYKNINLVRPKHIRKPWKIKLMIEHGNMVFKCYIWGSIDLSNITKFSNQKAVPNNKAEIDI